MQALNTKDWEKRRFTGNWETTKSFLEEAVIELALRGFGHEEEELSWHNKLYK